MLPSMGGREEASILDFSILNIFLRISLWRPLTYQYVCLGMPITLSPDPLVYPTGQWVTWPFEVSGDCVTRARWPIWKSNLSDIELP